MQFDHAAALLSALFGPLESQQAYLDPGSGSILIQLLVAGALGAGLLLRNSWGKVKALFGFKPDAEDEDLEEVDPQEEE